MIGTLKTIDPHSLVGLILVKAELGEFDLMLHFDGGHRIDIEDPWEYRDHDNKLIDRFYSRKFRKQFRLPQLEGHKLTGCQKLSTQIEFLFDNAHRLVVYISGKVLEQDTFTIQARRSVSAPL